MYSKQLLIPTFMGSNLSHKPSLAMKSVTGTSYMCMLHAHVFSCTFGSLYQLSCFCVLKTHWNLYKTMFYAISIHSTKTVQQPISKFSNCAYVWHLFLLKSCFSYSCKTSVFEQTVPYTLVVFSLHFSLISGLGNWLLTFHSTNTTHLQLFSTVHGNHFQCGDLVSTTLGILYTINCVVFCTWAKIDSVILFFA